MELDSAALNAGMGDTTPAAALQAAARSGLPTRAMRLELKQIFAPTLPCLLLLTPNAATDNAAVEVQDAPHAEVGAGLRACILVGLSNSEPDHSAEVIFPETAPAVTRIAFSELERLYAGEAVFPARDELAHATGQARNLPDQDDEDSGYRWLYRVLMHFSPLYRDVTVAGVCINLLALASPLFIMNVYDRVIPHNSMVTLWVLALGVGIACVVDGVLRALRAWYVDLAGRNVDVVLSTVLLERVIHARLDACPESPGELAHTLESFENLRETLSSTTLLAFIELPFVLLFIGLMAWLGGSLALVPLLAAPCMLLFGAVLQRPFRDSARESQMRNARRHAVLSETLAGLETVKGNLLYAPLLNRYENTVEASAHTRLHGRRLGTVAAQGVYVVTSLSSVALIIVGAYNIAAGHLSVGALVACVILLGRCLGPLAQLAALLGQWQRTRATLTLLNRIMALPEENDGNVGLPAGQLGYDLHEVSLSYKNTDIPSLDNLTLRIAPGERVGIVGGIGSGKTTLARVLMGLLRPTEGRVSLGGVDLRQVSPDHLRSRAGYLAQEVVLFSGTVRENLALGLAQPDSRRLEAVVEVAGVNDFVGLHPLGLDMPAGDRGRMLSGGQRQAVAMARALVRDPSVLVLDEPASHLDPGAELRLVNRLGQILPGRTLVLFTHRPAMLALVDRILVMERGRMVMDGPRDEIMDRLKGNAGPVPTQEVSHA